jgi:phosphoribosyl 1,2-cyclic phosphate phosphodiesterase
MKVTILGCGGSGGVPLIGPGWGECNPDNPKNRRSRVSILVSQGETNILCDTSPDFRAQALAAGINHLDAVLYTHDHADHTQGIDDLRFVKSRDKSRHHRVPVYGSKETLGTLTSRFSYAFAQNTQGSGHLYKPFLDPIEVVDNEAVSVAGFAVTPYLQEHGFGSVTTGYRIGNVAYSTDCVALPGASLAHLHGLDLFIVDCLRFEPHNTHAHFDQALAWVEMLRPKHTILTHMNHLVDYDVIKARCPAGVEPAYDGLAIEVPDAPLFSASAG